MIATLQQSPALDDVLRQFHGWQGVSFLCLCLLALALVLAALLSTRPYVIVVHTPDEDEAERKRSLDAAFNAAHSKYMNPFMEKGSDHAAR